MTPEQALHNLAAAAHAYRGTLDEHQALQQSVQVLAKALGIKPNGMPTGEPRMPEQKETGKTTP